MAPPAGTLRVGRYFLALLALLAVLYAIVFWPGQRHTPKLGLDLVGGTQVIFTAKTDGRKTPSKSSMNQAKQIMDEPGQRLRCHRGDRRHPGHQPDRRSRSRAGRNTDVAKLGQAAVLNFRGVVMPAVPVTAPDDSGAQPSIRLVRDDHAHRFGTSPSTSKTAPAANSRPRRADRQPSAKNLVGPDAAPTARSPAAKAAPTTPAADDSPPRRLRRPRPPRRPRHRRRRPARTR